MLPNSRIDGPPFTFATLPGVLHVYTWMSACHVIFIQCVCRRTLTGRFSSKSQQIRTLLSEHVGASSERKIQFPTMFVAIFPRIAVGQQKQSVDRPCLKKPGLKSELAVLREERPMAPPPNPWGPGAAMVATVTNSILIEI
jgi:hypothetical protein